MKVCCVLPVTSCVSSWLLLLTILTDTFLDDCRNSGRPCRDKDEFIYSLCGTMVFKLYIFLLGTITSTDDKMGKNIPPQRLFVQT